jgi:L-fuconolactonase
MEKEDGATGTPAAPLAGLFEGERKPSGPTQFGRIFRPDEAWLAKAAPEPVLEPDLAIVDTHHHLWAFAICCPTCWPISGRDTR